MLKLLALLAILASPQWRASSQEYTMLSLTPIRSHFGHAATPRIIGGSEVLPHSIPYQVALKINQEQEFCGGALISPQYVLTSAHCASLINTVSIILGAHNISISEPSQVIVTSATIIVHEQYDSTTYVNDIALLQLTQQVQLSEDIQVVLLPSREDASRDYTGQSVIASGWGWDQDAPEGTTNELSQVLQSVEVEVSAFTECTDYYNDEEQSNWVTLSNICTSGYRNRGICGGDAGGPLVYNDTLIGITSFGADICEFCTPSVYTKVGNYLDWIIEKTGLENTTSSTSTSATATTSSTSTSTTSTTSSTSTSTTSTTSTPSTTSTTSPTTSPSPSAAATHYLNMHIYVVLLYLFTSVLLRN